MADVRVLCTQRRMVGDARYAAGQEYTVPAELAERYPGYFTVLADAEDASVAKPKRVRSTRKRDPKSGDEYGDKRGLPTQSGATVELDGTEVGG